MSLINSKFYSSTTTTKLSSTCILHLDPPPPPVVHSSYPHSILSSSPSNTTAVVKFNLPSQNYVPTLRTPRIYPPLLPKCKSSSSFTDDYDYTKDHHNHDSQQPNSLWSLTSQHEKEWYRSFSYNNTPRNSSDCLFDSFKGTTPPLIHYTKDDHTCFIQQRGRPVPCATEYEDEINIRGVVVLTLMLFVIGIGIAYGVGLQVQKWELACTVVEDL